jgi:hypothetical protein
VTEPDEPRRDRVADLVEELELREAVGGIRGIIDSGLATTAFLVVYAVTGRQMAPALWAAVAATVVLLVVRLVRREPLRQAVSGVFVVAVSALVAAATGRAANFYLLGILLQAAYAVGYLVSLALGWPLLGVLVGPLLGEGFRWHDDPPRRRAYWWASWIWFVVFAVRLVVFVPLYVNNQVITLGIAKLALGWPMFAAGAVLSWLVLRRVPPSLGDAPAEPGEPPTELGDPPAEASPSS